MVLFINALAASAGGGLTYIRNVLPLLAAAPIRTVVLTSSRLRKEFAHLSNVDFVEWDISPIQRFWFEQSKLPELMRLYDANVLLSTGNFGLRKSPVPQILLSRNSIYNSAEYFRDLRDRAEYKALVMTYAGSILAKNSISWADITVAPSEAFADQLRQWSGGNVIAIHHGFDRSAFTKDATPLSDQVRAKLNSIEGALKLLFVSHYNYYRNFETLVRALPILREGLPNRQVRLLLTCELAAGRNPGAYRPASAANLVRTLGVADMVVELDTIPYGQLHHLYSSADLYVTPAYTETFAHPLVEAMSSGLPIVASDIAVHREIGADAAIYFERFSATALAEQVSQLVASPQRMESMAARGIERSQMFSWKSHVEKILDLCDSLLSMQRQGGAHGAI